jgi:hypothetical protein
MFELRIHQEDQLCFFDLFWGQGRRLSTRLRMSSALMPLYSDWQRAYLSFYHTVRGKVAAEGTITVSVDWRSRLVEAEARLLNEFHQWLQQAELCDLYRTIAQVSQESAADREFIDVFLTCTPLKLARLPWESWELGASIASRKIRMARVPATVRQRAASVKPRSRPRILVIVGRDNQQDFTPDWQQIERSLSSADLKKITWEPEHSFAQFQQTLSQALQDTQGWDVLFFAGHSDETALTGGMIGIAPGYSIHISEIAPQLAIARERGLQFALFNSCSGLSLSDALIDLGLSQVAVMREPVPNRVAQEFLVQFLQGLANYQDVHESLLSACQFLKTEKNLTYPSAHLIPSLFRYPEVELFRISPPTRWDWIRPLIPKRGEAIALLALLLIGWQLPVQQWLLERRVLAQAIYRHTTQRTTTNQPAPVLLVQIDSQSITRARIEEPNPIPQDYLAKVVQKIALHQPRLIGLDYLLDRPQSATGLLANTVKQTIERGNQFVFGAYYEQGEWLVALPEIANNSASGSISTRRNHMDLPQAEDDIKPLSYVLAKEFQSDWQSNDRTRRSPLTLFAYSLGQWWLDPVVDYSLPPHQIYTALPAWKLLEEDNPSELQHLPDQVVIIAPGGYAEAGLASGSDNYPATPAVGYWYEQANPRNAHRPMTGVEFHAYKLHHLLRQRLVIPIPDLWMILLAIGVGKGLIWGMQRQSLRPVNKLAILAGGSVVYSLMSLELYLSSIAILLPIILPLITVWILVLLSLKKQS